jgi:integrase
MLKLKPRGTKGIYWITGTFNGKRIRESTGTDRKEYAEIKRVERERQLLDHKYLGPEKTTTFAQATVLYLEGGGDGRFLDPLLDWFGVYKVRDITQSELVRFAATTYPGVSAATLNRHVFTPTCAVLRHAAKAGLCELPTFTRPKQIKTVVEYANDQWLASLLDAISDNLSLTAIVLFMTTTGARVGEACRLQWTDIEGEAAILRHTKNGDSRRVVLLQLAGEALARLPRKDARVFGYAARWSVNQAVERACKRAGIKYLSSHKWGRHAFAARLLRAGHTLALVAKAGGWRSLQLVSSVYGHLEQSMVDDAVRNASSHVGGSGEAAGNVVRVPEWQTQMRVPPGKHGVYVMSAGGYYKVGIAIDPEHRRRELQVSNPLRVTLHHVEVVQSKADAVELERAAHRVEGTGPAMPRLRR